MKCLGAEGLLLVGLLIAPYVLMAEYVATLDSKYDASSNNKALASQLVVI